VGFALPLLLCGTSQSFLVLGATKITALARAALVPGRAGFLKCDSDRLAPALHLAATAVPAALEFALLELMQ
jgi:hypothetical protein